ncbi:hypothetical protein [Pectobacterium actinidiae]|uniref:hypothetical protein n=1 Tax=Pectobacterium actinidiae TaxID=1507808 RepID=UPI0038153AA1
MTFHHGFRVACLLAAIGFASHAQAELFASSASSAGSASSGSVSDSLSGSSDSSDDDEKTADGNYRIIEIAQAPDRNGFLRVTMQADESRQHVVLDLPATVMEKQGLGRGDLVRAERRVYGFEFARGDTREAFYLVLADDWHDELATRPVASL